MEDDKNKPNNVVEPDKLEAKVTKTDDSDMDPIESTDDKDDSKERSNSWHHRLRHFYTSHKKYTIPASVLALVVIVGIIPWTRFQVAGLFLKQTYSLKVVDSSAGTPVSGAEVSIGSVKSLTGGDGVAKLSNVKVGHGTATISKKYYSDKTASVLVPILKQKNITSVKAAATGRQVKINVHNSINKQALADVTIKVSGTVAQTDSNGSATVVLPANSSNVSAVLSLSGYNDSKVAVAISDKEVKVNDYKLTPSGSIYFLSKRTGKLDVMKTTLDGSTPSVVLAGTGFEDDNNTALSMAPDGKHIALVSQRDNTGNPKLYIIDAGSDSVSTADEGNANFQLNGWLGNNLIYKVNRKDVSAWQTGQTKLKSYDASSGSIVLLDQTSAVGDATNNYSETYTNIYLGNNLVVFFKEWYGNYQLSQASGKTDSLHSITPDGHNQKVISQYDSTQTNVGLTRNTASSLYISTNLISDYKTKQYYSYAFGSSGTQPASITDEQFLKASSNYYPSPSAKQMLWSEVRDGKTAVLLGDGSGGGSSVVASLDNTYQTLGWLTDQYILVTKNGSTIYIMGAAKGSGDPIKITDYQASAYSSNGYY